MPAVSNPTPPDLRVKNRGLSARLAAAGTALFFACHPAPLSAAEISTTPPISLNGEYMIIGALHRTCKAIDTTLMSDGEFFTHELKLDIDSLLNDKWHFDTRLHLRQTQEPQI